MTRPRDRALVLTPRLPWPVDDGGLVALWQSLWSAAQEFDVTLVSLVDPTDAGAPVPREVLDLGIEIVRVPHRPPPTSLAVLSGTLGRWPYTLARFRSPALERELRRLVAERQPAFALINNLHLATALDALTGTATVLREQNLEFRWLERVAAGLANPMARVFARAQASKMRRVEAELCARCDLVLAIQDDERDGLRMLAPTARVETVPVAVDLERYPARETQQPPIALIVGSFNRWVNEAGATEFLAKGWPELKRRVPDVRLRIAGKGISDRFAATIRAAGAEAVGYVEEIAEEFSRASLMVVPLWIGAGARVKVIEALAAGLPVVATPLGAEGLGLVPGRDYLEHESARGLASAAAELLADDARSRALSTSGLAMARQRFSLPAVARLTNELCRTAVARHAAAGKGRAS